MEGELFGKYRLIKKIAVGGMAEIYYARMSGPSGFQKDLVVKKVLPALASQKDFIDMFADEARIVARMNHPNIVQVFDFGNIEGQYYIAMEYVNGRDLRQVIDRHKAIGRPMDAQFALAVARDVAKALQYAHSMTDEHGKPLGIIHRDVTPKNILISFQGAVKLTDFGVAKARARITHTRTGVLKGKFAYMAPEQVMGRQIDHRMDLFSLSTVLWETLSLQRLFKGDSEAEILGRLLHQTIPSIRDFCTEHSECIQGILNEGLAKDPDLRFQSAGEMVMAIRDCMSVMGGMEPDIGAYMKEIFGVEDLQTQAMGTARDDVADESEDDRTLAMSEVEAQAVDAQGPAVQPEDKTVALPESEPAVQEGQDAAVEPQARRSRTWLFALIILVLSGGLGAAWWFAGRGTKKDAGYVPAPEASGPQHPRTIPRHRVALPRITMHIRNLDTHDMQRPRHTKVVDIPSMAKKHHRRVVKTGILSLNAVPWAYVSIDGKAHGVTPVISLRLRAGRHRIVLKMGRIRKQIHVVIRPGRKLRKLVQMMKME